MSSTTVPNPANGSFPSRSSRLNTGCLDTEVEATAESEAATAEPEAAAADEEALAEPRDLMEKPEDTLDTEVKATAES